MENSATVTINKEQQLYVIPCQGGYTCLGFDVAFRRATAIALELKAKGVLPTAAAIGTIQGYNEYRAAVEYAAAWSASMKQSLKCELTPQLIGLEGQRVEVVDTYGERRRFIVGKSTGWLPCHLEIPRRGASGGEAVSGAPFKELRIVA